MASRREPPSTGKDKTPAPLPRIDAAARGSRAQAHLISRAEMARKLGISRAAITKACRPGGRLAPACQGQSVNVLHSEAQRWLLERAAAGDHQEVAATPPRETPEQLGPELPPLKRHGGYVCEPDCESPRCPAKSPAEQAAARARRRPPPTPEPIELPPIEIDDDEPEDPQSIEDLEEELGPKQWTNLAELAEPLTILTERYGNAKEMEGWIRARKALEEARKAQMLRERLEGRLIARTTVVRMFEHLDTAFRLLLSDAPRAIATRVAPQDVATVAALVRDVMSQHLSACRSKIDNSLAADDPMAPLAEAAE